MSPESCGCKQQEERQKVPVLDSKNIFEIILAILLMIIMRLLLKGAPVPVPGLPGVVPPYPAEQNPTIA